MSNKSTNHAAGLYRRMIEVAKSSNTFMSMNKRDILDFPLDVPIDKNVYDFMEDSFEKYVYLLETVKDGESVIDDNFITTVKTLECVLLKTLKTYMTGDIYMSYRYFQHGLLPMRQDLPIVEIKQERYYRMRAKMYLFDKKEFYPLDNDKRYLCKPERFSVSGYPCLYVGYSEKVCLKEMGTCGSIIDLTHNTDTPFRILDLTFEQDFQNEILFVKTWPLIAACYMVPYYCIKRDKTCPPDNIAFKIEYVIPQFLTLFVKRNLITVDGIRYYTVRDAKLNPYARGVNDMRNIMFFCQSDNEEKYNQLVNSFKWGKGYNLNEL